MNKGDTWHSRDVDTAFKDLNTSRGGVKGDEVNDRLGKYGANVITWAKRRSNFRIVWV